MSLSDTFAGIFKAGDDFAILSRGLGIPSVCKKPVYCGRDHKALKGVVRGVDGGALVAFAIAETVRPTDDSNPIPHWFELLFEKEFDQAWLTGVYSSRLLTQCHSRRDVFRPYPPRSRSTRHLLVPPFQCPSLVPLG
jgi:hypothetical protein